MPTSKIHYNIRWEHTELQQQVGSVSVESKSCSLFWEAGLINPALSSGVINPQFMDSEFSATEQMIRVGSINCVHSSMLSMCITTIKSHHQLCSHTMIHHGNWQEKKGLSNFTPLELEVLMCAYGEYEHIFRKKKKTEQRQRTENWRGGGLMHKLMHKSECSGITFNIWPHVSHDIPGENYCNVTKYYYIPI